MSPAQGSSHRQTQNCDGTCRPQLWSVALNLWETWESRNLFVPFLQNNFFLGGGGGMGGRKYSFNLILLFIFLKLQRAQRGGRTQTSRQNHLK